MSSRDMPPSVRKDARPVWVTALRVAPFVVCAALSLWVAGSAPQGRKPFAVDFSLVPEDLARSITKVPHLGGVAALVLLAVLAFGMRRLLWAFLAVMLLGIGWEIGEATAVGHYARLADLAPNLVSGLTTIAIVATIRSFLERRGQSPLVDGSQ